MKIEVGDARPMGASYDGAGTNFALFSDHAENVELCIYDPSGKNLITRVFLPEKTHGVWHGYLPKLEPGSCYGYRVYGKYDPHTGYRFNPNKLLLDPYAKQLQGAFNWHESHYGFDRKSKLQDLTMDESDSAEWMPKAVVTEPDELLPGSQRHRVPWHETVIYETHVRGFTMRHPEIPELERGTFSGFANSKVIDYLKSLGITSVELLPTQSFINEAFLAERGLVNYWGYNSLSFFAPHQPYLSGNDRYEFRNMVRQFHDAGIEVLLDVVYNHTCEGNHLGPTLSFRGIDNASYYRLLPSDRRFYLNESGCGNAINIVHPKVLQMVTDSLRYWVQVMGVDGFRFDLASVLGRDEDGFSARNTFFQVLEQDPVLSGCKLIAEPWDIGPGGYQLGHYPAGWSEWNDRYRDSIRRFWRGDAGELPELARRLHGSGDLFEHSGRRPYSSINFITSHDGFTLRDLVSYKDRHNEANLEQNRDGHRANISQNNGVEGESDDPEIRRKRLQQQRNFLVTLFVSQGVPMMLGGDELGRTQNGNNNAYCQDNEINWFDWSAQLDDDHGLQKFVRQLLKIRQHFPVLQADKYRHLPNDPNDDSILWLNDEGELMRERDWHVPNSHALGYLLAEKKAENSRYLFVIFNAANKNHAFMLPSKPAVNWWQVVDTATSPQVQNPIDLGAELELAPKSVKILSSEPLAELININ